MESIWIAFYKSTKEVDAQHSKEVVKHIAWAPSKSELISKLVSNTDVDDDKKEIERFKHYLEKYEVYEEDGESLIIKKIKS
jgi:hypothetical protein